MNPSDFKQFEKSVLFLQFRNTTESLSAVLGKKILEVEDESREKVYSSSSGADSEA